MASPFDETNGEAGLESSSFLFPIFLLCFPKSLVLRYRMMQSVQNGLSARRTDAHGAINKSRHICARR
jgi:hypothetical protein